MAAEFTGAPLPPAATSNDNPADGQHDPFGVYRKRGGMRCPHCRHVAKIRTSGDVTPLIWTVYYDCSHPGCGHSWVAQLSYLHGLSPSAVPDPEFADLPMRPMAREDVVRRPDPPPEDDPNQPRLF